jgi:tetratricopeptide (TPR) repeat protein
MKILFKNIAKEINLNLNSANSSIKVAIAWFTNEDLFDKLCFKLQEGLNVELLIINDLINNNEFGLDFQRFIDLGGKLYFGNPDNLMHHKFCVIDNEILINGSYNWTYFAEFKNLENIIIHTNSQEIQPFNFEFDKIIKELSRIEKISINIDFNVLDFDLTFKNILSDDISLKSFKYESIGDYTKAIKLAKHAMDLNPSSNSFKKQFDNLQFKQDNVSKALFIPSATIIKSEKLISFNSSLNDGIKAYKKKNFSLAIQHFKKALSENSDFAELYFWIGLCNWKLNVFQEVIETCNQAIVINPKYAIAYNLRGVANSEKSFLDKAISDFTNAITNQSKLFKAYFNRGITYKRKGESLKSNSDFNKAIELLNITLSINPSDEEALSIRGDALSLTNQNSKAREDYTNAKKIYDSKLVDDKDFNCEARIRDGLSR